MPRVRRSLASYLSLVRFAHTLFALPFAYLGMLLAAEGWPGWTVFAWVSAAMVGARTASMALNRLIDAQIDAANPRTRDRELPSGRLTRGDAVGLAVAGFALLGVAGWALNPLTFALLPVAVAFLALYPYTKRFTWLCHYWLGVTIGAAAAGGWIAVTGAFSLEAVLLWLGVGLWIAGFDIIYALLDVEVDRAQGLFSAPSRLGERAALTLSAVSHGVAWLALAAVWPVAELGWGYGVGLVLVGVILGLEQYWVRRRAVADVLRSFNANLWVGTLLLAGVIVDLLRGG